MTDNTISPYGCFVMFSGPCVKREVAKVINARRRAERLEAKQPRELPNKETNAEEIARLVKEQQREV